MASRSGRSRPCANTGAPEMSDEELAALKGWLPKNKELKKGRFLEVGTGAGGTLCFMLDCFEKEHRPNFVVVDTLRYFQNQLEVIKQNLVDHELSPELVEFKVMTSADGFLHAEKKQQKFDFMLIDGSHKIRHVMADMRWMRLLKTGGIACLHDYSPRFKGVCLAVDRFLFRNRHFQKVGLEGSLLCLRKVSVSSSIEVSVIDRMWAYFLSPLLQLQTSLRKRFRSPS